MALQFDEDMDRARPVGLNTFTFGNPRFGLYRSFFKRTLDILLVLIAAPMILLLVIPFAMLIAVNGGSPFYSQKRIGMDGKEFTMWKLRSMVPNAKEKLATYLAANPDARTEWDKDQKLKMDPRITPIGRIIRKTSIDELPQFWNVLTGDMSIVGPRPIMVEQKEMYPCTSYYALRPGITGFWQISERNETSFTDRAPFDAQYFRELSFGTDLWVMMKTFTVVVRATGY
ncbi:MAG: sugar transferase [Paracoccaceae bacterium]|jgi:lipopolysaccharide/colanic/teichoic acid biosynthesis glycosyltransferase|nr:sugar transferase [Paracoccaceae bacterium]